MLYRVDLKVEDAWGDALGFGSSSGTKPKPTGCDKMKQEYVQRVLRPEDFFSVPVTRAEPVVEGEHEVKERSYFQVLEVITSQNRSKVAQTTVVDDSELPADGICCLLYTSPSPRDQRGSRMPSSA